METPMLEKMHSVHEQSQAIGEFLDLFLREKGISLCMFREAGTNGEPPRRWKKGVKKAKVDGASTRDRSPKLTDVWNGDAEDNPAYEEWPDQYMPINASVEKLLAEYFEIDLVQVEKERRALLEELRDSNRKAA